MRKPLLSIEEMLQQASQLLPGEQLREGVQKNTHAVLQSMLSKMDVVSREEFDAQAEALRRSQERLKQLEGQLQELSELVEKQAGGIQT